MSYLSGFVLKEKLDCCYYDRYEKVEKYLSMINRHDLCLLILLPVNEAAKKHCHQTDSSLICQIQTDSHQMENGLLYKCIQQSPKMSGNANVDLRKFQEEIRNNNASLSLVNSLKNLTIEKKARDVIEQRRVKINKKLLSSSSMTNRNKPHTFSLWYNKKKKKNIADRQDDMIK